MRKFLGRVVKFMWVLPVAAMLVSCEGGGDGGSFVFFQSMTVSSRQEGVYFRPATPGTYRFTITGGSYTLGDRMWLTALTLYRDRPVETENTSGRPHPTNPDAAMGDFEPVSNRSVAEQSGMGSQAEMDVQQYVIFIVPDDFGTFGDNSGSINLLVERKE